MIKMSRLLLGFLLILVTGSLTGCLGAANYIEDSYEYQGTTREEKVEYDDAGESEQVADDYEIEYEFRRDDYLEEHFDKHGDEFDYATADEYLEGANRVIADEDSLYKTEEEDGDHIYYLEETNEFVIVSTDGYIRTYFKPSDGLDYFNRQ